MAFDDTGYYVESFNEEVSKQTDVFKKFLGDDINIDPQSNYGRIIRAVAYNNWKENQKQQQVWLNGYGQFAAGVSLDYLAYNRGIFRNQSQQATATVNITGSSAVLLEGGTTEFMTDDGVYFVLVEDTVLSDVDGDGTFTATASVVSEDYSSDTNVQAHTIIEFATPVDGVDTVDNPDPATGGADEETDDSLRQRYLETNVANIGSTIDGIYTALDSVNGIRDKYLDNNTSATTDANGTPAHALQIVAYGGLDQDIADAIRKAKGAGTQTFGSISKISYDIAGNPETINFNRATEVPIFFSINVKTNSNWNADSGTDDILNALQSYVNNLHMGQPVYISSVYGCLAKVPGIDSFTVQMGTDKKKLAATDVVLGITQAPVVDSDEIEVTTTNG